MKTRLTKHTEANEPSGKWEVIVIISSWNWWMFVLNLKTFYDQQLSENLVHHRFLRMRLCSHRPVRVPMVTHATKTIKTPRGVIVIAEWRTQS